MHFQILNFKKMAASDGSDRYRLMISDGHYLNCYAMLGVKVYTDVTLLDSIRFSCSMLIANFFVQQNNWIENGELTEFSIIQVKQHICNNAQGKKVIVLMDLEIIKPGSEASKRSINNHLATCNVKIYSI